MRFSHIDSVVAANSFFTKKCIISIHLRRELGHGKEEEERKKELEISYPCKIDTQSIHIPLRLTHDMT